MSNLENAARRVEEILNGATLDTVELDYLRDFLAAQQAQARLDRWIWIFNFSSFALLLSSVGYIAFS